MWADPTKTVHILDCKAVSAQTGLLAEYPLHVLFQEQQHS